MKTEEEVKIEIAKTVVDNRYVLDRMKADIFSNHPRALIQSTTLVRLDALYWCLGEERPKFRCEEE